MKIPKILTDRIETLAEGVTLYCGDCREILPTLGKVDAVITDPPYGIKRDAGMGGDGYDGFGNHIKRRPREYAGGWDGARPGRDIFEAILRAADVHVIWGGNYFADLLPASSKWLWWDKLQTMPSYSDGELAWTSIEGTSTKKFVYNGSGLMAKEKGREHPTQKPVQLMKWCFKLMAGDVTTVLDPYMGSGTTGVAAVQTGRKFIGIEIDPGYFEVSCRRVEEAIRTPDMFIERPKSAAPIQQALL